MEMLKPTWATRTDLKKKKKSKNKTKLNGNGKRMGGK